MFDTSQVGFSRISEPSTACPKTCCHWESYPPSIHNFEGSELQASSTSLVSIHFSSRKIPGMATKKTQSKRIVFQPSIFRCKLAGFVSGRVVLNPHLIATLSPRHLGSGKWENLCSSLSTNEKEKKTPPKIWSVTVFVFKRGRWLKPCREALRVSSKTLHTPFWTTKNHSPKCSKRSSNKNHSIKSIKKILHRIKRSSSLWYVGWQ